MPSILNILILCFLNIFLKVQSTELKKCELISTSETNKFPSNFQFGVATAAYQIEGGWNEDGKGPCIWDGFTHEHPKSIADHSTGDVGADSYHHFEQDLRALKELNVNTYRFSISWSRVLPNGDISLINQKGLDYYNMIINKLLENNIEPMVTIYHFDMPEELNKYGGFTNEVFIKYFLNYADLLFKTYGDRVKTWVTFNEPFDYCLPSYGEAIYPPMVKAPGIADYLCMDVTLKAHAKAYRMYKAKYFEKQRGKVGIAMNSPFYFSKTNETQIMDRALQFKLGWLANPLFGKTKNYPQIMLDDIARNSIKEGRSWSRLESLTDEWSNLVNGACDFLGLNYYRSTLVELANPPTGEIPSWEYDVGLRFTNDESRKKGKSSWLYCMPDGLEAVLKWIRLNYNNVEVIITENGWSDDGQLNDPDRIEYLKSHMQAALNAIADGCNVTGYIVWSLLDNFEWLSGFTEKFGLYHVNMSSPNKERIAKDSAKYFKQVIEKRELF